MGCRKFQRLMQRELDREAAVEEAQQLGAHLELCPSCRAYGLRLQQLEAELAGCQLPPAPPGLTARVLEAAHPGAFASAPTRDRSHRLQLRWLFWPAAAVAVVLALWIGAWAGQEWGRSSPRPPGPDQVVVHDPLLLDEASVDSEQDLQWLADLALLPEEVAP